MQEIKIRKVVS